MHTYAERIFSKWAKTTLYSFFKTNVKSVFSHFFYLKIIKQRKRLRNTIQGRTSYLFWPRNKRLYTHFAHFGQISTLLSRNLCPNLDHFAVCDDELICFGNEIYILHRFHTYFLNFYAFIAKLVIGSHPFCSLWWWVRDYFWQQNNVFTHILLIFANLYAFIAKLVFGSHTFCSWWWLFFFLLLYSRRIL